MYICILELFIVMYYGIIMVSTEEMGAPCASIGLCRAIPRP